MKLKLFAMLGLCLSSAILHAQGVITVFSEDGDRFYLVLNGIRQNTTPQTNVRVDGLMNEFYNGKIVFEDANKPEITKNLNTKDAASGQYAEVTFKIKHTKDGELKLRYFGATPVPVNYTPSPDMYVVHYGQSAQGGQQNYQPQGQPTYQPQGQSTYQQTNTNMNMNAGNGGVTMSVNVADPNNPSGKGAVNMNITMPSDPGMQGTITQTSSSSYSQTGTQGGYNNNNINGQQQQMQQSGGCGYAMDWNSFSSAKKSISQSSFEDTKFSTAKSVLSSNCVSTDEVVEICNLFSFEETKLKFAKFAYGRTTDPNNYFKVGNVFTFDASRNELNNFISNGGH